jgi:hypothetical protein
VARFVPFLARYIPLCRHGYVINRQSQKQQLISCKNVGVCINVLHVAAIKDIVRQKRTKEGEYDMMIYDMIDMI